MVAVMAGGEELLFLQPGREVHRASVRMAKRSAEADLVLVMEQISV